MFCRKCGAKLPEDAAFCNKCGFSIDGELPSSESTPHSHNGNEEGRVGKSPKIAIFIFAGLALIVGGLFALPFIGNTPKQAQKPAYTPYVPATATIAPELAAITPECDYVGTEWKLTSHTRKIRMGDPVPEPIPIPDDSILIFYDDGTCRLGPRSDNTRFSYIVSGDEVTVYLSVGGKEGKLKGVRDGDKLTLDPDNPNNKIGFVYALVDGDEDD